MIITLHQVPASRISSNSLGYLSALMQEGSKVAMMKDAFTMIEIVFVIVIIGIITAIAIPKLSATRDDAKVRVVLSALTTCVNEASVTYMKTGSFGTVTDEKSGGIACTKARECFSFNVDDSNGTLEIVDLNVSTAMCKEASAIASSNGLLNRLRINF